LGRRRRRIIKVVKRKLPTVFSCPSCGEEAIKVVMSRSKSQALIQCAACGLKQETDISPADQMVDVYCRFTDKFYGTNQASGQKQPDVVPQEASTDRPAQLAESAQQAEDEAQESGPVEAPLAAQRTDQPGTVDLEDEEAQASTSEESETDHSSA